MDIPWIEKYRPQNFNQIISQKSIINVLRIFISTNSFPHIIFVGPSGTGKTTMISCCIKELYGEYHSFVTMNINASNERGIDIIRSKVKDFISTKNNLLLPKEKQNLPRIIILDEFDSMTIEAQNILRQTIEDNSDNARFCIICNENDKINYALKSRCMTLHFLPLKINKINEKLTEISKAENININSKCINLISSLSNNDMRNAINILQIISTIDDINEHKIYNITNTCSKKLFDNIINILHLELNDNYDKLLKLYDKRNFSLQNLLNDLVNYVLMSKYSNKTKIIDLLANEELNIAMNVDHNHIILNICSIFNLCKN